MHTDCLAWDIDLIMDMFDQRDTSLICDLPLSMLHQKNGWFWLHEKKGSYMMPSGYGFLRRDAGGHPSLVWD